MGAQQNAAKPVRARKFQWRPKFFLEPAPQTRLGVRLARYLRAKEKLTRLFLRAASFHSPALVPEVFGG